jgi:hypothetical protein
MGVLKELLLALNRNGRAFAGSAAYPEPPQLHIPPDLRDAVDIERQAADDADPDH